MQSKISLTLGIIRTFSNTLFMCLIQLGGGGEAKFHYSNM